MLEIEHARKQYPSAGGPVRAVDDVSLTVAPQECVALFGPSGSGKTTLLLLAAGLLRADAGAVRFEGKDLATLEKRELLEYRRAKLGLVFQNFNLVDGLTAEENVALTLLLQGVGHRDAQERARRALDDVALLARSGHTPSELSGGEQQRVAIARALVGGPKLVLADEPTGNLDTETGDRVLELLSVLPCERGAAVVVVTHDTRVARFAERVLGMRDGRLAELDLETRAAIGR
jgi:putative ABC transport system ATP-binding protein